MSDLMMGVMPLLIRPCFVLTPPPSHPSPVKNKVSAAGERGIKGTSEFQVVTPGVFCAAARVKICHNPSETPSPGPAGKGIIFPCCGN